MQVHTQGFWFNNKEETMYCNVLETYTTDGGVKIDLNHWTYSTETQDFFVSIVRTVLPNLGDRGASLYHAKTDTLEEAYALFHMLKNARVY